MRKFQLLISFTDTSTGESMSCEFTAFGETAQSGRKLADAIAEPICENLGHDFIVDNIDVDEVQ